MKPARRPLVWGLVAAVLVILAVVTVAVTVARRPGPTVAADGSTTSTSARTTDAAPGPSAATPTTAESTAAPAGAPTTAVAPVGRSAKKGVSAWYFAGVTDALADVRASWYYNWSSGPANLTAPPGVEFVPMIWGSGSVTQSSLDAARKGRALLGFNEPDLSSQANMTVAQALDLWPQLQATGVRLGSPAPAYGAAAAGSWFDQFMVGAAQRGYRVDFIALHWYGSDFSPAATNQLRGYLQATYNRYHKPIWLTEYALINFSGSPKYPTQEQQADFVRSSTAMLESLSYVERYAWFALPATDGSGTGLYQDGHTPTTVGVAYRAAGSS